MEKQAMDRRRRSLRPGLLIAALFFAFPGSLRPQDAGQEEGEAAAETAALEILTQTSPATPVAGGTWAVTILADHPRSAEVTVKPPRFPASLILERVRTELRLLRQPGRLDEAGPPPEPRRWTVVEFLFTVLSPGEINLSPFEVTAAGKRAVTRSISARVAARPGASRRNLPVLAWERPPASLVVGEEAFLTLILRNWDDEKPPPRSFLRGRAPDNAVLEEVSVEKDAEGGADSPFRYRVRLIPLSGERAVIESFSFQADNAALTLPALSIALKTAPVSLVSQAAPPAEAAAENQEEAALPPPAFPDVPVSLTSLLMERYRRVEAEAKTLWEAGRHANALACIRRAERDSLAGPAFVPLRRAMESSLGLTLTEDEQWSPWRLPVFLWIVLAVLVAVAIAARRFRVTSKRFRGFRKVAYLAGGLAALVALAGLGDFSWGERGRPSGQAVLEKTAAYRVPDPSGTVNAFFGEGQPARVRFSQRRAAMQGMDEWVYAETADGRSGWVPQEAVISY